MERNHPATTTNHISSKFNKWDTPLHSHKVIYLFSYICVPFFLFTVQNQTFVIFIHEVLQTEEKKNNRLNISPRLFTSRFHSLAVSHSWPRSVCIYWNYKLYLIPTEN